MARHKTFAGGTSISEFEPINFTLNGEEFNCHPAIPGAVLLEFVKDADSGTGDSAKALYNFLASSMPEEEYEKLQKTLKNPKVIIEIETIGEIVTWLVEEYSSRPTQRPENSSNGDSNSGPTSTEEQSSQVAD